MRQLQLMVKYNMVLMHAWLHMYLILVAPPKFILYPSPQYTNLTQTAIFTCNATGHNIFGYQWIIGSGSFPSKVTGINNNTLVIPDVRSSDDNTYTCVVNNEGGNTSSNATKLTVTGMTLVRLLSSNSVFHGSEE